MAAQGVVNLRRQQIGRKELRKLSTQGIHAYPMRPLSYSSLKEFAKSPLHYIEYVSKPKTASAPMIAGKVFEALLFGRDVQKDFVVFEKAEPTRDFRIKANQVVRNTARAQAQLEGKEAIENTDLAQITQLAALALQHPFMKRIKRYAFKHPVQKTIREKGSGLSLTGIPDLSFKRNKIGVDIKFVGSVAEFRKRIFSPQYAYWLQAAMYSLIYGYQEFYFFAVQSEPHHYAQAFHLNTETLAYLIDKLVNELLFSFRWHLEHGFFASSEDLTLPEYF
ncbi:MAG: PD-(D/E)XK nuclease-like domain-containing protein [Bacteroidota bacterium]